MPTATVPALQPLQGTKTMLLTTYRRDGTPVATPVTVAVDPDGQRAWFRTWDRAWKARRLARDAHVTAAPSTFRGRVRGEAIPGRARLVVGDEERRARRALARRAPFLQGILVPLAHRLMRYRTLHYELRRDGAA